LVNNKTPLFRLWDL